MDTTKTNRSLLASLSRILPPLRPWRRRSPGAGARNEGGAPEPLTPRAFGNPATPEVSRPLSGRGGAEATEKAMSMSLAQSGQTPPEAFPLKGTGVNDPAAGAAASLGDLLWATSRVVETPTTPTATPEKERTQDSAADDLRDLFAEEYAVDENVTRLAARLEDVDVNTLVEECRKLRARLRRRK